jgi:hypothetical protein
MASEAGLGVADGAGTLGLGVVVTAAWGLGSGFVAAVVGAAEIVSVGAGVAPTAMTCEGPKAITARAIETAKTTETAG